jgi:uncharacterized repeat protein (TIGR01451 family)
MRMRFFPAFVTAVFLLGAARAQAVTNTPTPTRSTTPTPTPTSNRPNDLSITKSALPNPGRVGENLTYTLTVHNAGPASFAPTVALLDSLPDNVTLVSVTAPGWSCSSGSTSVFCSTSLFFNGNTRVVTIVVRPTAVGSLTNTALVQCTAIPECTDPDPSNNTASVTTEVGEGTLPIPLFLRGNGNPVVLSLGTVAPTATVAKYRDSAVLGSGLRNPWVEIGAWPAPPALLSGSFVGIEGFHAWLGLKNSDDQGTQFDLRAEVWKNGLELVAAGETSCIKGLVRDPANAKETAVALDVFTPVTFNGVTDSLSLKALARIGTHCSGPSHAAATGLRFYFDGAARPSGFSLTPGLRLQ